ncbi:HU family DNA-binding protein [Candidatus Methylacidithermus pantelleriae]|uniref:DNA-binding protein HU-beta/integration host factor subunit alpha n=1 Tax=Candidatus Methylacidithermus pantelleriae TaxID=2744239 RepID=A0A8J2BTJ5_9BACT|nr:HU family DNA-binding protein [Candidatus Methylacidithermus pantelleriae]CAF0698038.1 DNA-binding protein HU-beta/integration host factor subunit alpha [Candidatus Methylacidithermus pantelleriae]
MGHVTRRDLIARVSDETGFSHQEVGQVLQKLLDCLKESLGKGETVELRRFGIFQVQMRKARKGRNPKQPETDIIIPPRPVVKFKPGKEVRELLAKLGDRLTQEG